jgi:integrase
MVAATAATTKGITSNNANGLLVKNFLFSIKSEATKRLYTYCLNRYMRYYHFDNVEDLTSGSSNMEPRIIEANIIQYIVWLSQDQKLSSVSVNVYLAAIIHFYAMNDIVLNRKKINMGEFIRKQKDRAYTTEEIHKLLDFCDERSKALVLLLASTGIRIGSVPGLKLRHLSEIVDYKLYKIVIYEGTKEEYYCFTIPEAATAIDTYLNYRVRLGEKLTDNSPLFREQFDINDQFAIRYPKNMKAIGLTKLLIRNLHRSGVILAEKEIEGMRTGKKRNVIARAHGFRKFATTNLIRAKINPEAREMLLGHSISLTGAYYRPGDDEILQEYVKAIDLLTISDENRLRHELVNEQSKQDAIADMQLQQNAMKDILQSLVQQLAETQDQNTVNALSRSLAQSKILVPKNNNKNQSKTTNDNDDNKE